MNKGPRLDIVVVNWHTPGDLVMCLNSIEAYGPDCPYSVTVVNVEPEKGDHVAAEMFVDRLHHWYTVTCPYNVGYNVACNIGAAEGHADLIVWMNADVKVRPGALDMLISALDENPDWGVVGPRQVNSSNKHTAAGIFGSDEQPRHRGWMDIDIGQYADVRDDSVMVSGSLLMMRRAVAEELTDCEIYREFVPGDEPGPWGTFTHFYGDTWLSVHARAHGYKATYYGPAKCEHELHGTRYKGKGQDEDHDLFRAMADAHGMGHN